MIAQYEKYFKKQVYMKLTFLKFVKKQQESSNFLTG